MPQICQKCLCSLNGDIIQRPCSHESLLCMSGTKFNVLLSSFFLFPAATMVPLLFLVATTTTSNSSGNGNHTQGRRNTEGNAPPRHVRLNNFEQLEIEKKNPIANCCSHHFSLRCDYDVSSCLIIAFSTALLLPDDNELQQLRTVIYGSLCVFIDKANRWLRGWDSWPGLHTLRFSFSVRQTIRNEPSLISVDKILQRPVIQSGLKAEESTECAKY